ncbi:MAG: hypothetical protein RJB38_754 [Pseudomonadota bacterium]|jgi:hypothetical protein
MKFEIHEGQWSWLIPHQERGAVIVVAPDLDLSDVGHQVAQDHQEQISAWISDGLLSRPQEAQLSIWTENPEIRFRFLIVQPYVLIQELGH